MRSQRIIDHDCFFCDVCRQFVYDELLSDAARGVAAQERVNKLPLDWHCANCGINRKQLLEVIMSPSLEDEEEPTSLRSDAYTHAKY